MITALSGGAREEALRELFYSHAGGFDQRWTPGHKGAHWLDALKPHNVLSDEMLSREQLEGRNTFKRSFKASYGAMEQLDSIRGSTVAPVGGGAPIDIKRVLPVDRETQDVRPSFALGDARAEDRRQRVALLANSLYDFLRGDERSMASAAAHLKRDLGDEQYSLQLRSVGAQSLSDVVRLIGDLELTRNGNYVRARRT